jgi:hypothetical protein
LAPLKTGQEAAIGQLQSFVNVGFWSLSFVLLRDQSHAKWRLADDILQLSSTNSVAE